MPETTERYVTGILTEKNHETGEVRMILDIGLGHLESRTGGCLGLSTTFFQDVEVPSMFTLRIIQHPPDVQAQLVTDLVQSRTIPQPDA